MNPRVLFVGRTRYRLPLAGRPRAQVGRALGRCSTCGSSRAAPARDPRFHLLPPRPLDGPRLLRLAAGGRGLASSASFRPDAVIAESPFEAAPAEVAVRLARSPAKVVVEVHGDWRVSATPLRLARSAALLKPVDGRRRGLGGRPRRRPPRRLRRSPPRCSRSGAGRRSACSRRTPTSARSPGRAFPCPPRRRVLFVGVLERYKNVEGLAAAWRLVRQRVPEAELHLVGSGTLTAVAEGLERDGARWDRRLEPAGARARRSTSRGRSRSRRRRRACRASRSRRSCAGAPSSARAPAGSRTSSRTRCPACSSSSATPRRSRAALERILTEDGLAERLGEAAARRVRPLGLDAGGVRRERARGRRRDAAASDEAAC